MSSEDKTSEIKRISLLKLFWIFFKIGLVLFGGGYAILPFLKSEMCDKEKICTMEEITDYYALSQCFPGLVAGNVSMFTGYKARGVAGAIAAVTGVCLPAYLSIVLIFSFLSDITHYPIVQSIFSVLDIAVCVLIFLTILELWNFSVYDKFTTVIFILAVSAALLNVSPFIIVISAGLLGLFRHFAFPKKAAPCCSTQCSENSEEKEHEEDA